MQHAAMMLVPLVPQPTRPPSPESGPEVARDSSDLEARRALREAQDREYAQAEADDLWRQSQRPGEPDTSGVDPTPGGVERATPTAPSPVDVDLVRSARTRRFAPDASGPQQGH